MLCAPSTVFAQSPDPSAHKAKLTSLTQKISRLKSSLSASAVRRSRFQKQLERAEVASGSLTKQLQRTHGNLRFTLRALKGLHLQAGSLQVELNVRKQQLGKQLRQLYLLGQPSYLHIFLNEGDPAKVARLMNYYHILQKAQLKAIVKVQDVLDEVANNRQQTHLQLSTLAQLQDKLKLQQGQKNRFSKERRLALDYLARQIKDQRQQLQALQTQRQQLQSTLDTLQRAHQLVKGQFLSLRHQMAWPVQGSVIQAFGSMLAEHTQLRADGLVIAAAAGKVVHAIAPGRVVFARWMAGYGLLLIIDHGEGYMTLYGRNQALYKNKGDYVRVGDKIATVGSSGGFSKPSLYFAMRHFATPIDPTVWMRSRTT